MADREFVAVNWTANQIIDEDSMDQLNSNMVWMRNHKVEGKYQHLNNATTEIGLKILCGRRQITPRKADTAIVRVGFTKLFTPDSTPVVTTSITSPAQVKFFSVINGINRLQPNHMGFECKVNVAADAKKNDKFASSIFVNWIAMGY
jgi:hypothetical protein